MCPSATSQPFIFLRASCVFSFQEVLKQDDLSSSSWSSWVLSVVQHFFWNFILALCTLFHLLRARTYYCMHLRFLLPIYLHGYSGNYIYLLASLQEFIIFFFLIYNPVCYRINVQHVILSIAVNIVLLNIAMWRISNLFMFSIYALI